jgi:hypothetical protein
MRSRGGRSPEFGNVLLRYQLPTNFLRSSAATFGLIESYPAVRR